eukprot:TRINITY_DN141_c0_g1_i3.p1 TRINITY_DN141_c0_g1~~TRINITY_DN141_c0_g1_i3.p1  ORF type:complete len:366 (+),score=21.02 TRINITY_DN141_c0_g1_i3:43-1098(+)
MESGAAFEDPTVQGQAEIWQLMFAFVDSMVLKCAMELGIADIINSQGKPLTLQQIATHLPFPSPDTDYLYRIMRFLVRKRIFSEHCDGGDVHYGLTPSSKWILRDAELSLAPMALMQNHPAALAPWHCFAACVKEGGIAFKMAHGSELWDFCTAKPEFNDIFNRAMACSSTIVLKAVISGYKAGFDGIRSLVDVAGGTGTAVSEIVKAYPHIKGINFDLPHVIATAPRYKGVSHVSGDMFTEIPAADAVFMKWVLHDWSDDMCVKILKKCKKAIPEKCGKVILVDVVLRPDDESIFRETGLVLDLVMVAHTSGGKERTEAEWKNILEGGGFLRYNIIQIPSLLSIIEAYPN